MDVTTEDAKVEELVGEMKDEELVDAADLTRRPKLCWIVIEEEVTKVG